MLRLGRKRNQLFYTLLFAGAIGIGGSMFQTANAANSYVPELNIYQQGASPKIEIGIDMADADVMLRDDFSNDSTYNLRWGTDNDVGNQSVVRDTTLNKNVYKLQDTINTFGGNEWWSGFNQSNAQNSRVVLNRHSYPENGQWVSINLRCKSVGNSYVMTDLTKLDEIDCSRGVEFEGLKFAETVDFRNRNNRVVKLLYNGDRTDKMPFDIVSVKGRYTDGTLRKSVITGEVDFANKTFTEYGRNNADFNRNDTFYAGDPVLKYEWLHTAIGRNIANDGRWHTISCNTKLNSDTDLYNFSTSGMRTSFVNATDGELYMADVKIGKASRVQIQRDNSTQVYEGYDSDIIDTGLVVKPNAPDISALETLDVGFKLGFEATTNQEKHTYKARSCRQESNDWSIWSKEFPVTMVSTPSKYHVKLYKNGNLIKDEDTTAKEIIYADAARGDKITGEIYTIDTEGQKSSTTPINYTVKQTLKDYKADVKQLENDSNKVKKQYSYEEKKDIKANVTKAAEDLRTNPNLNKYKPNTVINGLDTDASEFKAGDKLVNIYIK